MIITLSRLTESGARTVGTQVSKRMGVRILDVDMRGLVAQRLKTSVDVVTALDEQREPAGVRIMRSLGMTLAPETGPALNTELNVTADDVEKATVEVILDLAVRESLIIIGRGARWVLGDRPDALHVRLVAPLDVRVGRYMAKKETDSKTAQSVVQSTDRARAAHIQCYFHVDWNNPENYHLVLNTGLLTVATATDLIVEAAERLTAAGNP